MSSCECIGLDSPIHGKMHRTRDLKSGKDANKLYTQIIGLEKPSHRKIYNLIHKLFDGINWQEIYRTMISLFSYN